MYEHFCKSKGYAFMTEDSWMLFIKDSQWAINWWAFPAALNKWFKTEFDAGAPAPWSMELARLQQVKASVDLITAETNKVVQEVQRRKASNDLRYTTIRPTCNTAYACVFRPQKKDALPLIAGGAPAGGAPAGGAPAGGAPAGGAPAGGAPAGGAPAGGAPAGGAPAGGAKRQKAVAQAVVKSAPAKSAAKAGGAVKAKHRPTAAKCPAHLAAGPVQAALPSSDDEDFSSEFTQDRHAIQEVVAKMRNPVEIFVTISDFTNNVFFVVDVTDDDLISKFEEQDMISFSSFADYKCRLLGLDDSEAKFQFVCMYFRHQHGLGAMSAVGALPCKLVKTAGVTDDRFITDCLVYEEMLSLRVQLSYEGLKDEKRADNVHDLLNQVWDAYLSPDEQADYQKKREKDEENAEKLDKFREGFYKVHKVADLKKRHTVALDLIASDTLRASQYQTFLGVQRKTFMYNGGYITSSKILYKGDQLKEVMQFFVDNEDKFSRKEMDDFVHKQGKLLEIAANLVDTTKTRQFEEQNGDLPDYFQEQGMEGLFKTLYEAKYMIYLSAKKEILDLLKKLKDLEERTANDRRSPSPSPALRAADRSSVSARGLKRVSMETAPTPSPPAEDLAASAFVTSPVPSRGGSRRASRQVSPSNMREGKRQRTPTRYMRPSSDAGYGTSTKPRK